MGIAVQLSPPLSDPRVGGLDMPTPMTSESHADFVERCIPIVIDEGTAKDGAQGKAICESMWEQHQKRHARGSSTVPRVLRESRYLRLIGLADGAESRTATFEER